MNINKLNPFAKPSADMLALEELEEARRQLLLSHTALEWAQANVEYNTKRVARLEQRVKEAARDVKE